VGIYIIGEELGANVAIIVTEEGIEEGKFIVSFDGDVVVVGDGDAMICFVSCILAVSLLLR
jgi:hypothetical protein